MYTVKIIIVILLALNLGVIIFSCFSFRSCLKNITPESKSKERKTLEFGFLLQLGLAVLSLVIFAVGALSYNSFINIEEELKKELTLEMQQRYEAKVEELEQIVIDTNKGVVASLDQGLDSVVFIQTKHAGDIESLKYALRKESDSRKKLGRYLVSRIKIETPSVGRYHLKFKDLGIGVEHFQNIPALFIQEHGSFHAYATEVTTEGIELTFFNAEDKYIYISLLLYGE